MLALVAVAGGGALGALARYQMSVWIYSRWPGAFPTATFLVNVTGCLLLGIVTPAKSRSSGDASASSARSPPSRRSVSRR